MKLVLLKRNISRVLHKKLHFKIHTISVTSTIQCKYLRNNYFNIIEINIAIKINTFTLLDKNACNICSLDER